MRQQVTVKDGQNIYDIVLQYFGTLDNLYEVLEENNLTLNDKLASGYLITINNKQKGLEDVKRVILLQGIEPKSAHTDLSRWILRKGIWEDNGVWLDNEFWKDN